MQIHELKTWPTFFEPLLNGTKRFEIRNDDRGFESGDILYLREYDPNLGKYSGRSMLAKVDFLMRRWPDMGLKDGYCVMSITKVELKVAE